MKTRRELLDSITECSRVLPDIIELEKSGIRDGDGFWHGCDPLDAYLRDIENLSKQWRIACFYCNDDSLENAKTQKNIPLHDIEF